MISRVIRLVLLVSLAHISAWSLNAQSETPVTDTTAKTIQPIAKSDLANEAEVTYGFLSQSKKTISGAINTAETGAKLEEMSAELEEMRAVADGMLEEETSIRLIQEKKIKWERKLKDYNSLENKLSDGIKKIEALNSKLADEYTEWSLTVEKLSEEDLSKESLQRPKEVVGEVELVQQMAKDTINLYLGLMETATKDVLVIQDYLTNFDDYVQSNQGELFSRDKLPFLEEMRMSRDSVGVADQVGVFWRSTVHDTADYMLSKKSNLAVHFLIAILVLFGLFWMKNNAAAWEVMADPRTKTIQHFIQLPLLTTLFIAFTLFFYLYPNAPMVAGETVFMFIVIILIPIGSRVFQQRNRNLFYLISILYVVEQIQNLMFGQSFTQRSLVLLESVIATSGITYILISRKKEYWLLHREDFVNQIILILTPLAFLIYLSSIGLNWVGSASLSYFLVKATTRVMVVLLFVILLYRLVSGLLILLLYGKQMQSIVVIANYKDRIFRFLSNIFKLYFTFLVLQVLAKQFGFFDELSEWITAISETPLGAEDSPINLKMVVSFVLIIWASIYGSSVIKILLAEEILPRFHYKKGKANAFSSITKYIILTTGFFVAAAGAGIDLNKFSFIAGALGVGIGFGLQNVVGNFVSGLILMFERPVNVGDIVLLENDIEGEIISVGARACVLRTYSGAEVIIPNNDMIYKRVTNWTLSDKARRMEQFIETEMESDPRVVLEIISKAVKEHNNVLTNPSPILAFLGQQDNKMRFRILYWVTSSMIATKSDVAIRTVELLKENGIKVAIPETRVVVSNQNQN